MSKGFTAADVPDQTGKTVFVTGANTGLGFEASKVLAGKGARVLLGCRNREKAEAALALIKAEHPDAQLEIVDIDLGDLASVKTGAEKVLEEARLDVLINNAGLMMPPRHETKDGFESQFGVNHLGHFALVGHLLPLLEKTDGSRIVNTSSNGHKMGDLDFEDLNSEKKYSKLGAYAASKLANLLFSFELNARLSGKGGNPIAVTVHPGAADTELARYLGAAKFLMPVMRPFFNTAAQGAWPTLMGASWPEAKANQYFGPRGIGELAGPAKVVQGNAKSQDPERARTLWEASEEMTGVRYLG
ncbi:MAG: SDR family NAD(P)-dependent oxidoreductase [Deltaproteobacteria bacterium]|nr:SDR family NAD(P)-dependent oxidoreductase [Deltaproteobacteria bacterium]